MFKDEVVGVLEKHLEMDGEEISSIVEIPPDTGMGDYAFPCFVLSKKMKKSPAQIAQKFAKAIKPEGKIAEISCAGPYLNFIIEPRARAERVIESVNEGKYWKAKGKKKILIEYPSPNTNKPLHLGHVRNMALGKSISRILKKAGNEVVQVNLNNDRGIHICKSMLAYKKWGNGEEPDKKPDHFIGDYYVKFAKEAEKDPSLEDEAQEMLRAWENGDEEVRALWKKMNNWALEGFKETYDRYGISFDKTYNEHEIYEEGKKIVLDNMDKFQKDETGAIIAPLEDKGLPDKVVLRSDGTSIYSTQDLALTKKKIEDYHPDMQVWVVGNEQDTYFEQLFAILDMIGMADKEKLYHLSYGLIALPDGRMKSREGKVVDADNILDEMEELAAEEIRKRREDWDDEKTEEVAEKVAMAAIMFFILSYDPRRDFTFDPESSLSFEGDTGPYLQYTHARISGILEKADDEKGDPSLLVEDAEQTLIREMEKMPEDFAKAAEDMKPSSIANRLVTMAQAFNTFYHNCPVLDAEKDVRKARISLITAAGKVLAEGMELLGFEALEEM